MEEYCDQSTTKWSRNNRHGIGPGINPTMRTTTNFRQVAAYVAIWALLCSGAISNAAEVEELRTEYRKNPLGIDVSSPRLSWIISSGRRGEIQTAYQILAASKTAFLTAGKGDLWDSGKVVSDASIQVEYAGKPLSSGTACFWKVPGMDGMARDIGRCAAGRQALRATIATASPVRFSPPPVRQP